MQRYRSAVLVVFLLVLAFLPVAAQKITGDIAGDVTDASGAVVPNATVTARNTDTGFSRTIATSSSGSYRLTELPIGNYKVNISAPGFKTIVQDAQVTSGGVTHADFRLSVGERAETIEVQGSAPLLDLSPNNNNYVDATKIENVPLNGRDFNSLLAITPGVQRAPGGGFLAVSINGARTTSNNYFIDGLYNNDRYYGDSAIGETGVVGIPATVFPPEAIQEMNVQETPSSEFGVKGGAPILLNMKSGTNNWHGSGTYIRHSGWGDAANYFSNHVSDNCASPGECRPTQIHNHQFNGTVGGPIVKDKAFIFGYYEGQRYKSLAVSRRFGPTPAEINGALANIAANGLTVDPVGQQLLSYFPLGTNPDGSFIAQTPTVASANGFGIKADFKLSNQHAFNAKYIFGDSLQSAPPYAGLPAGQSNKPDMFNSVAPSRAQMLGLSWTWTASNNKILESRLGLTRFAQIIGINNKIDPAALGVDTGPLDPGDFGVPYVYLLGLGYGGYIGGVQGYPIVTRPIQTWDWSEHFSWIKGNHSIRLGGNFQRAYTNSIRNNARTGMVLGYFTYYTSISGDPVQDQVEQLLLGKADNANRAFGNTHRYLVQNSVGVYAQDDWKIKPRLTINYGLRYDIFGNLRDRNNQAANFFPSRGLVQVGKGLDRLYNVDYRDLGPHAGFAWDVFGNGSTAVRAGYSLTYDIPNFAALASPYSFARARAGAFTQPNLGLFSVNILGDVGGGGGSGLAPNDPSATCYDPVTATGDYICFTQGPVFGPSPTGQPPFNAFSIVQDFRTPHYHNFNLSVQQQFARNNVLTVGYSGQRGGDMLLYRDLNASPLGSPCSSASECDPLRPFAGTFPDLRHIIQATNLGYSKYDSLQVSFNQRGWHGIDTQYNLTWSKCFDTNSVNRGGAGDYPQINNQNGTSGSVNVRDTYGLCDHDVRLNFNVGGVYNLPAIHALGKRAGDGWRISTIYTAISGRPFTALLGGGGDPSGQGLTGSAIRAAWDGSPIHYNTRNPDQYVVESYTAAGEPDPCGDTSGDLPLSPFYVPCAGTAGNSRRNQLIGPGLSQWDVTLIKATKLTETVNLEFRWEVFNVLNRANFHYFPDNTLGATFGTITKTSDVAVGNPVIAQGGPRNMNFALKLTF
jgi:hypothetical protein